MLSAAQLLLALSLGALPIPLQRFDDSMDNRFRDVNSLEHVAQLVRDVLLTYVMARALRATVINVFSLVQFGCDGEPVMGTLTNPFARGDSGSAEAYRIFLDDLRNPSDWTP